MENKETAKVVNLTTAKEIASICKTCKECETHYKGLLESGIDKETAKVIIKSAKDIINNRKETAKEQKVVIGNWFANYENIGNSILLGLLKEKEFVGMGLKKETAKFDKLADFIGNWYTKTTQLGQPIRKIKGNWKYRELTANNIRGILKECLQNVVKVNNLQSVNFVRIESSQIAE